MCRRFPVMMRLQAPLFMNINMSFSILANNRWLRLGLIGVLAVIALVVTLAFVLVDSRKVADVAAAAVEKTTGRRLTLNGPVSLKLFPHLAVVAEDVALSNAPWAAEPEMAKADRVAFSLDWLPLLQEQISINEVTLQGATLNLQAAPAGKREAGNWVLTGSDSAGSKQDGGEEFHLQSLQLTDVTIHFRDHAGAVTQQVVIDSFTGSVTDTQVDFSSHVRWQKQPADLKGRVVFKPDTPLNLTLSAKSDRIDLRTKEGGSATKTSSASNQRWMFDTQPLGFEFLPLLNGTVDVAVKTLVTPSGVTLPNFASRIALNADAGGILTLERFTAGLGQGVVNADGKITGYTTPRANLTLRGHAEGFTLEKVIEQASAGQKSSLIQGGPGELAFNLNASGVSMRDLASSANGEFQMSIGPAQVSNALLNAGGDFILTLVNTINPTFKSTDTSQVTCAVAYLPINNGLMRINQSAGIETARLNMVLDGQVNLKTEALNINITTNEKSGLTTGLNVAGLVQVKGTLRNPKLAVNKTGVIKQAATVGLAVFTAGISLAAQNVVSVATRSSPCQNVLKPWSSIDGDLSARSAANK